MTKLPIALELDLFFNIDTFSYRLTDGAEQTSNEIFVTVGQSLGDAVMRVDAYTVAHDGELRSAARVRWGTTRSPAD